METKERPMHPFFELDEETASEPLPGYLGQDVYTLINKITLSEAIEAMEIGSQFELRDEEDGDKGPGKPVIFRLDEFHHQILVIERLGDSESVLSVMDLLDIKDVRFGTMPTGSDTKSRHAASTPADDRFCIQCGSDFMTWSFLNVFSFSKEPVRIWVGGLKALLDVKRRLRDVRDLHMRTLFLDMSDTLERITPMNMLQAIVSGKPRETTATAPASPLSPGKDKSKRVKKRHVESMIKSHQENSKLLADLREICPYEDDTQANYEQFVGMSAAHAALTRTELADVFYTFTSGQQTMTAKDLERFFEQEQGQKVNELECKALIDRYEMSIVGKQTHCLTVQGFASILLDYEYGNLIDPIHDHVHQDMDKPLSHYFISSSHNTYIEGHQLKGESSVELYVQALLHGCRSLEIDTWDGESGEPEVTHAHDAPILGVHNFTSRISFEDVVKAIGQYAFVASPYPIILSLEDHCSIPQQKRMAEIFKKYLGEYLLNSFLDDHVDDCLPSPERLKYKILLKHKRLGITEKEKEVIQRLEYLANGATLMPSRSLTTSTTIDADQDEEEAFARETSRAIGYGLGKDTMQRPFAEVQKILGKTFLSKKHGSSSPPPTQEPSAAAAEIDANGVAAPVTTATSATSALSREASREDPPQAPSSPVAPSSPLAGLSSSSPREESPSPRSHRPSTSHSPGRSPSRQRVGRMTAQWEAAIVPVLGDKVTSPPSLSLQSSQAQLLQPQQSQSDPWSPDSGFGSETWRRASNMSDSRESRPSIGASARGSRDLFTITEGDSLRKQSLAGGASSVTPTPASGASAAATGTLSGATSSSSSVSEYPVLNEALLQSYNSSLPPQRYASVDFLRDRMRSSNRDSADITYFEVDEEALALSSPAAIFRSLQAEQESRTRPSSIANGSESGLLEDKFDEEDIDRARRESAGRRSSMSKRIKAMFKRKSGANTPNAMSTTNSLERGVKLLPEDAIPPEELIEAKGGLFASLLKRESVRRLVDEGDREEANNENYDSGHNSPSPILSLGLTDEEKAATLSGAATLASRRGRGRFNRKQTYDLDSLRPIQRSLSKFQTVEELIQYGHKQPIVAEELSDMIFYTRAVKFTRFAHHDEENTRPKYVYETSSFNESTAIRLAQRRLNKFTQHNMYKLTRVYPIGRRYISSNFNPIPMWAAGCQMVAMNWQTLDDSMMIYHAMFRLNGGSGYVLKPQTMRSVALLDSYLVRDRPRFRTSFHVTVLSGQGLDCSSCYVELELFTIYPHTTKVKTASAREHDGNVAWLETFRFTVDFPELCMLRFTVYNTGAEVGKKSTRGVAVNQVIVPINEMRKGYRHLALNTMADTVSLNTSLFLYISGGTPEEVTSVPDTPMSWTLEDEEENGKMRKRTISLSSKRPGQRQGQTDPVQHSFVRMEGAVINGVQNTQYPERMIKIDMDSTYESVMTTYLQLIGKNEPHLCFALGESDHEGRLTLSDDDSVNVSHSCPGKLTVARVNITQQSRTILGHNIFFVRTNQSRGSAPQSPSSSPKQGARVGWARLRSIISSGGKNDNKPYKFMGVGSGKITFMCAETLELERTILLKDFAKWKSDEGRGTMSFVTSDGVEHTIFVVSCFLRRLISGAIGSELSRAQGAQGAPAVTVPTTLSKTHIEADNSEEQSSESAAAEGEGEEEEEEEDGEEEYSGASASAAAPVTKHKAKYSAAKEVATLLAEMDELRESLSESERGGGAVDARKECRMSVLESLVRELQLKMLLQIKIKITDDIDTVARDLTKCEEAIGILRGHLADLSP